MGIYLNPGNKGFWESIRSEIYVDKTGLIAHTNAKLNTEQNISASADRGGLASRWRLRCLRPITAGAAIPRTCLTDCRLKRMCLSGNT